MLQDGVFLYQGLIFALLSDSMALPIFRGILTWNWSGRPEIFCRDGQIWYRLHEHGSLPSTNLHGTKKKKIFHSTIQEIPPDVRLLLCGVRVSVHYSAMFGQAFAVSNGKSLRSWAHIAQLHHCRSPQFPLKRYLDIIISRSLVTGMGIGVAMRWPYRGHIDGIDWILQYRWHSITCWALISSNWFSAILLKCLMRPAQILLILVF